MPGQRKSTKKSIGGYVDSDLKASIKKEREALGVTETTYVEIIAIETLLRKDRLTSAELESWAKQGRISEESINYFKKKKVLK